MNNQAMPPAYWLLHVPETGNPQCRRFSTERDLLQALSEPREDAGWLYGFLGYSLPLIPGLPNPVGFIAPTGREARASGEVAVAGLHQGVFVPATATADTTGRAVET